MTASTDREILNAKIGELLHSFFVSIRAATFAQDAAERNRTREINDLADLAHNLPRFLVGHDEYAVGSLADLRAEVVRHVRRYHPDVDPDHHCYVELLDLDAETFLNRYREHKWNWPEPQPA